MQVGDHGSLIGGRADVLGEHAAHLMLAGGIIVVPAVARAVGPFPA